VAWDWERNPSYGVFYLAQVPRGATISTLEAKLYRYSRQFPVDLVIIDYLALLRSDRRGISSPREELASIMKDAKVMAATFDDGRGVPIISPWQISREKYQEALRVGYYGLDCMSDTSESEKTADIVVSMLGNAERDGRYGEVRAQILKNRDGEMGGSISLDVDYATGTLAEKRAATDGMTALLN
jgi:replicative DNA helicase